VGEAGIGYVLRPGFILPPLMFGDEEIEALVLGLRWVEQRGDGPLGVAAADALAKIAAVLPAELRERVGDSGLLAGPGPPLASGVELGELRRWVRAERKLRISYEDAGGRRSERTIWPFA